MGIRVLHDPAQGYAVLYDSVTGMPLALEVFSDFADSGLFTGAEDMAERFLADATAHFGGADLRTLAAMGKLHTYQRQWFTENAPGEEWGVKHAGT